MTSTKAFCLFIFQKRWSIRMQREAVGGGEDPLAQSGLTLSQILDRLLSRLRATLDAQEQG
jgi:hypothetical protein